MSYLFNYGTMQFIMRRIGFTLIELLVTISVIAILMGILVAALRAARQQAYSAACGSNLRQLSLAMTVYEQDNNRFPYGFDDSSFGRAIPAGGYPGNPSRDMQGLWWFHFLTGTLGKNLDKDSVFWCPARKIKDPSLKANILCGNYGVNRAICRNALGFSSIAGSEFAGKPLGLNQIRGPAKTLLIIDSGYSLTSWRAVSNADGSYYENRRRENVFYVPGLAINKIRDEQGTISSAVRSDAVDGRHPGKTVNVIFADGHMAPLKADDMFVKDAGDRYYNRSPLWLPDK